MGHQSFSVNWPHSIKRPNIHRQLITNNYYKSATFGQVSNFIEKERLYLIVEWISSHKLFRISKSNTPTGKSAQVNDFAANEFLNNFIPFVET